MIYFSQLTSLHFIAYYKKCTSQQYFIQAKTEQINKLNLKV